MTLIFNRATSSKWEAFFNWFGGYKAFEHLGYSELAIFYRRIEYFDFLEGPY
jgi:hypothetical protein